MKNQLSAPPKKDLSGLKQHKVEILSWSGKRDITGSPVWLMRCDCGKTWERTYRASLKSCGCGNNGRFASEDLSGKQFGQVTIIGDSGKRNPKGYIIWNARCDCGNVFERASYAFHRQTCLRCPECTKELNRIDPYKSWKTRRETEGKGIGKHHRIHRIYSRYFTSAQQRGLVFELGKDQVHTISSQPCFYCGSEAEDSPSLQSKYNGIDRIDNQKGYTLENSVPCCAICNRAKSDMSYYEFIAWIDRLKKHAQSTHASLPLSGI